uniref:Uncharacterized protein n=1 Tax=Arundo donax TaxID=35708 RepID=A0A0A9DA53_ARUDO
MDVKPEMKPEPAGGAYNFLCAFERPLIPSACTVLVTSSGVPLATSLIPLSRQ